MNDKEPKLVMSKVMTVFPELKIIPKIKENGSISVDIVTGTACHPGSGGACMRDIESKINYFLYF